MLTQKLFDLALWFVDSILGLAQIVIPPELLTALSSGTSLIATLLSFGPVGMAALIFATFLAVDVVMDVLFFARNTYKLIPAKAT